jgi:hypothetical protein
VPWAVRQWPGCETLGGIQIIRNNRPTGSSVRVTLYGKADEKTADRAITCVQKTPGVSPDRTMDFPMSIRAAFSWGEVCGYALGTDCTNFKMSDDFFSFRLSNIYGAVRWQGTD